MSKLKKFLIETCCSYSPTSFQGVNLKRDLLRRNYKNLYCSIEIKKTGIYFSSDIRKVNFELLTAFYTTIASGNINLASQNLSMSQSALSQALQKIEMEMGELLFNQSTLSCRLMVTPMGLFLFNYIQRLYKLIDECFDISSFNFSGIVNYTDSTNSLTKLWYPYYRYQSFSSTVYPNSIKYITSKYKKTLFK